MSKTLQFRRGTTSELSVIAGAVGELFVDTTKDTVVVMDGSTAGGFPLATESQLTSLQSIVNSKVDITSLASVATTGSYNDLTNKPTSFNGLTLSGHINLTGYVSDYLGQFQGPGAGDSILTSDGGNAVRWQNLKTINGQSVLGSGNLVISGGGSLDTSAFATKVDLLILDSDDIEEGLTNQYFTKQKVANVLTSGTHSGISFAFDGDSLNASILSGGSSFNELQVKDKITLQQSITTIGTVISKSIVPPTTQYTEYVSNQSGNTATNPTWTTLNYQYAYFYSSYADIYSPTDGNTKIKELFAVGNTVRITKNGYWWDVQITSHGSSNASYLNIQYNIIGYSTYQYPSDYQSYWGWNDNISFSSDLPVAQRYVVTLDQPIQTLVNGNKLFVNNSSTGTPYDVTVTSIGSWDIGVNSPSVGTDEWRLDFGTYNYYANQDNIRKLLSTIGTLITISDNTWMQTGIYQITAVGTDQTWNSTSGFSATLKYISGTNYPNSYTSLSSIFQSYLLSASGSIVPNYTTEYLDQFATQYNSTSYISFDNYDFLKVGDIVKYIPATTSIQFKDDAGNNVKAISYNNATGKMTYEGLPDSAIIYLDSNSNTFSAVAEYANDATNGASPRNPNVTNSISLGKNSGSGGTNAVSVGNDSNSQNACVAVGHSAIASQQSIVIGASAQAGQVNGNGVAIGYGTYAPGFRHTNLAAQDIFSSYPWYALPNLHYRPNYRRAVTICVNMNRAGTAYIYTQFAGSSLQHSSGVQDFTLHEWLNMQQNPMARIKLNWHITSESSSTFLTYYAKGASEYLYSPNSPNATKLINIGSDTTIFGTDTYANELNITLENSTNNSSKQMMKFTANPSDTTSRRIVIDLEATFS